ncbi:alpha/beta hydrolase [Streptomyces sp. NPDC059452]|uniref:alpha/beta hydrolase n=1 Tax=Streptomyces sp. NPDC059452 TaxID=3346835 RepID=UPI0036B877E2
MWGNRGSRGRRRLSAVVLTVLTVLGTGSWTTGAEPLTPSTPPGIEAWQADRARGERLPDPATASPAEVSGFFARATAARLGRLLDRHPGTLGNLDGAPVRLRYAANRKAIRAEALRELTRAEDRSLPDRTRRRAHERAGRYGELLLPGRQILAFDPRGRGQLVEVYGDLTAAARTAVVVPGSDIDLMSFDRAKDPYGTPSGMAKSLHGRMAAVAPSTPTAVIAWAGYTTPSGIGVDAATGRLAEAGAPRLSRLLSGLAATGAPAPAVFCHSYGSVVCGLTARQAQPGTLGDLVFVAAPGTRAGSATGLGTTSRVWAATAASDWIQHVAGLRILGLGHGADPSDPAYGARPVPTARVTSHTGYFAPGSDALAAFTDIALGRPPGGDVASARLSGGDVALGRPPGGGVASARLSGGDAVPAHPPGGDVAPARPPGGDAAPARPPGAGGNAPHPR